MATIDDFKKLELRIGKVLSAERIEGSDKLLKLMIGLGNETRQILAGIAQFYEPETLVGKEMPVIVNLEPRIFRIPQAGSAKEYESQGMILCADAEGRPVILEPDREVPPGSIVR